jgi:hypothetical protein
MARPAQQIVLANKRRLQHMSTSYRQAGSDRQSGSDPKRPQYLPRTPLPEPRSISSHRGVNVVLGFAIVVCIIRIGDAFHRDLRFLLVGFVAVVALNFLVDLNRNRRHQVELRERAFQDWMDRAIAIARQHRIKIDDSNFEAFLLRFRGGLTPDKAVRQEIEARELDHPSRRR